MASDADSMVLLTECGSVNEASVLRSLLESNHIRVLVQAEHHAGMFGPMQALIQPRVLVAAAQVEAARALLKGFIIYEGSAGKEESLADGMCAVHEKSAVALCARCGNFLCADCKKLGDPAVCESCLGVESRPPESQLRQTNRKLMQVFIVIMLLTLALPLLLTVLNSLFHLSNRR